MILVNVSDETYIKDCQYIKRPTLNFINCFIYEGINLSDLKKMVSWMIFKQHFHFYNPPINKEADIMIYYVFQGV